MIDLCKTQKANFALIEMDLKKISDVEWEILVEGEMNVPARIFASWDLMSLIRCVRVSNSTCFLS